MVGRCVAAHTGEVLASGFLGTHVDIQILVRFDQRSVEVAVLDRIGSAPKEVADAAILTFGSAHGLSYCGPFWSVKGLATGLEDLAFLFARIVGVCDVGGWITSS